MGSGRRRNGLGNGGVSRTFLREFTNAEAAAGTSLDDHEDGHMISLPPESGDTSPPYV
jgi:hypothetical protein